MGSPNTQKSMLSCCMSTMTMDDYGLARLKELSEQSNSLGSVSEVTRINEIIDILSNLAASLREGMSCFRMRD